MWGRKRMKDNTIVELNVLEIDMLIHILDEVVSSQKIPEVITEEIRQELFAELDIAKILTDLKGKLGRERLSQSEPDAEETYIVRISESEIDSLENGDYIEVESVIEEITNQVKKQKEDSIDSADEQKIKEEN